MWCIKCDAIWRKVPKKSKIDFQIFDVLHRFKLALQDSVVEKILSLIVCSLWGFKHCHSGKHSRLLSHHIHIRECCECGYSVFLSEDDQTGRTDTAINLCKYAFWKKREILKKLYRLVATSPASPRKSTLGFLGLFLQIASQMFKNESKSNKI